MTDLRKAAEMALEALESANNGMNECHEDTGFDFANEQYEVEQAIQELRQALAQPEQEQYVTKVVSMHEDGTYITERIPLPKREWVGLTRRELDIATLGLEDLGDCYKAIEAKLKEKNT